MTQASSERGARDQCEQQLRKSGDKSDRQTELEIAVTATRLSCVPNVDLDLIMGLVALRKKRRADNTPGIGADG